MQLIGHIKQVQVQPSPLKIGHGPAKYYDPAPLRRVNSLHITKKGVLGLAEDDSQLLDIHHADHPNTRQNNGLNSISLGFTSHYQAMRDKFGAHLTDGIAGENILIESATSYALNDLGQRLAIQSAQSGDYYYLTQLMVAAPCVPFSTFAADQYGLMPLSNQQIKEALQFLLDGMRGFYATLDETQVACTIQAGDAVYRIL